MLVTDFDQTFGRSGDRLLPSRRMQQTIGAADQRFGDAVGVVNKIVSKTAFDAQVAIVERFAGLGAGNFYDFIILNMQV